MVLIDHIKNIKNYLLSEQCPESPAGVQWESECPLLSLSLLSDNNFKMIIFKNLTIICPHVKIVG